MATLSSLRHVIPDVEDELLNDLADLAGERGTPVGEQLNKAIESHLNAASGAKKAADKKAKDDKK